jgi:hypothetical protein
MKIDRSMVVCFLWVALDCWLRGCGLPFAGCTSRAAAAFPGLPRRAIIIGCRARREIKKK